MPVPATKHDLLQAIDHTYRQLTGDLARVPDTRVHDQGIEGHVAGSLISPHALVSYLVGWNELLLKWHRRKTVGEPVELPEEGYSWNRLGPLARKFYADYAGIPFPDLLARLETAKGDILAMVESQHDPALFGQPWYRSYSLGRMIHFNSAAPYANARTRLRRWLRQGFAAGTTPKENTPGAGHRGC